MSGSIPFLAMSWINPGMLGFMSLAVIPIIIYLINRLNATLGSPVNTGIVARC